MRGPAQYLEKRFTGESSLDRVMSSDDRLSIPAVRAVAGLMAIMFTAITAYAAKDTVDTAIDAYRVNDGVVAGVEAFSAAGEVGVDILAGWTALEMTAFIANSSRRIKELNDA